MSDLFLNANFVNNSGYVNKIGKYNSRNIAFRGVQKDEFVRSAPKAADKPSLDVSNLKKGIKLYETGDYEECIKALTCAIEETDKPSGQAFHCRGSAERLLGRYDEALKDYTSALEIVPNSTNTMKLRGRVHYLNAVNNHLKGDAFKTAIANAMADFDTVLEKKPEDTATMRYKADAYMALGEYKSAVDMLDSAIDIIEDKVAGGSELSKPERFALADMHFVNGNCLMKLGEITGKSGYYGEAADEYADASELRPDSTNCLKKLGRAYYEYATKSGITGEEFSDAIDASIANFDNLLEMKFDPETLKYKADALMAKGSFAQAEETLDAVIGYEKRQLKTMKKSGSTDKAKMNSLHSSLGNSHHLKGGCLRRQGKYDEAISEYTKALNYVPKSPNTMKMKGKALYQKALLKGTSEIDKNSLLRKSIAEYDSALALRKDAELYKYKAESLMKLRDFRTAIEVLQEGIDFENDAISKIENVQDKKRDYQARRLSLANLYVTLGDCQVAGATNSHSNGYPKAVEAYTKAIEIVPDSPNLYYARARVNYRVNGEECKNDIRHAVELDPSRPEYWSYLSKSLAYSDNEDEVQESFNALLTSMAIKGGWRLGEQKAEEEAS